MGISHKYGEFLIEQALLKSVYDSRETCKQLNNSNKSKKEHIMGLLERGAIWQPSEYAGSLDIYDSRPINEQNLLTAFGEAEFQRIKKALPSTQRSRLNVKRS